MTERDAEAAARKARAQIKKSKGFNDLLGFQVITYTASELREMGFEDVKWVGQYQAGSVDSEEGLTVLLNLSAHADRDQLSDTIRHEVGHGLFELLDEKDQKAWLDEVIYEFGPEEAFADDFMLLTGGQSNRMTDRRLFLELVRTG
jgi:hypothetical protein